MRCSEWGRGVVMTGILAASAVAASPLPELPEPALRDEAVGIQERALLEARPDWLRVQEPAAAQWATELGALEALKPSSWVTPTEADSPPSSSWTVTVLASRALGEAQLRELLEMAAGRPEVRIVWRGVAPGESLGAFLRWIQTPLRAALANQEVGVAPRLELDPRPFQNPVVDLAPTLIVTDGTGTELARVSGLSDPDWLLTQVRQGRRGNLGVRGPTVAVSEPDLIAELQRRLAGIDWAAERAAARARYWERAALIERPTAEQPRERRLDLTLEAQADVHLPDGTRVIRAGERVDPLRILPFRQRLFIFDATDPRQVADVARRGAASRAEGRLPLYLATRLDRAAGWAGYRAVQTALGDPLYLLTPDVAQRFQIERVPARVEARGDALVVVEWPPEG
ncbi:conjugal transfer protein TrbC [Allochromatium humboldtianum]|uniref:Conjugal transfer protein TrbC n=1 Tax=Allochromatium humboldtianum TaxID=504901 RepID=A0A850RHU9_9GAMM|nr:conjugal transfer protein TrbC [Allochromatium humboldtianum]NVZ10510.1 conjugal transfer protein TrbC [Allochromatium humboldtianum]